MADLGMVQQSEHFLPRPWATTAQIDGLIWGSTLELDNRLIGDRCDRYLTIYHASITPLISLIITRIM